MKKYAIGVIGAGAIAQHVHIPGYAAAENCVLTAVADPDPSCLKMVRDLGFKFGREYADHRALLANEKIDAVSICTPNKFHAPIAIDCLNAGCDVLLEKPIALSIEDGEAIKAAALKNNKRVMVAFTHRFNELNRAAKASILAGKIGKPYMYRIRFAHRGPWPGWAKTDWFYNKALAGGGALMDMAVHAFDLLRWYQGEITQVSAVADTLRKPIEVDDNVVAWVSFKDKCLGYIECGWTSPCGFVGVEIMGDKGSIVVDYGQNKATMSTGDISPDPLAKPVIEQTVLGDGFKVEPAPTQMAYFTGGLETDERYLPNLDDGLATLRLVVAAYASNKDGKRVSL